MYKQLRQHERHMHGQLKNVATLAPKQVDELRTYHQTKIQQFQHERLIHLFVTFFFGWLILFSTAGLFSLVENIDNLLIIYPALAIVVILLITEIFYVIYYYRLENGVQRLYKITDKLQRIK